VAHHDIALAISIGSHWRAVPRTRSTIPLRTHIRNRVMGFPIVQVVLIDANHVIAHRARTCECFRSNDGNAIAHGAIDVLEVCRAIVISTI
jgi:hypothetical protein